MNGRTSARSRGRSSPCWWAREWPGRVRRSGAPLPPTWQRFERTQGSFDERIRPVLTLIGHHLCRDDVTTALAPAEASACASLAAAGVEERGRACAVVQHRRLGELPAAGGGDASGPAAAVAGAWRCAAVERRRERDADGLDRRRGDRGVRAQAGGARASGCCADADTWTHRSAAP